MYGAKIRFPHALVMTFLFGRGTPRDKLAFIFRATKQHALNLGTFTPLYKFLTIALRRLYEATGGKGPVPEWHSLVAGLIGGYYVFGERTPVNEQVRPPSHSNLWAPTRMFMLTSTPPSSRKTDCALHFVSNYGIFLAEG